MARTAHSSIRSTANRIIAIMLFALFTTNASGQHEKEIKQFYVAYMQSLDHGNDKRADSLRNAYMTPELITKTKEYTIKTDANPIIRAQDVCRFGVRSLNVTALGDGWYMVKYKWDSNSDYIKIPLKALDSDGHVKITYITPEWLGTQYGDHLLNE